MCQCAETARQTGHMDSEFGDMQEPHNSCVGGNHFGRFLPQDPDRVFEYVANRTC